MMRYYSVVFYTYDKNGKRIGVNDMCFMSEEVLNNKEIKITWDNLSEIYQEYGLFLPFNIWNLKKGRKVSFFTFFSHDIKEWKQELNLTLVINYNEYNPPMSELLKYGNSEKVFQYVKERIEVK